MYIDISSTSLKKLFFFLLITSSFVVTADNLALKELESWDKNIIKIHNSEGKIYKLNVYIADSNYKRKKGLMYVKNLPINHGVLFKFDSPRIASMWMKNTHMSLDILFIDENQTITKIHSKAKPFNLKEIRSNNKVKWVLEMNGGLTKELNIKTGDSILF